VPIHTLCSVAVAQARPSWPVSAKAALEQYDPLASDIPAETAAPAERSPLLPRLVAGLVGDIPDGHVGLRTWSRPYIGRRWR
jgi:hypothetical protein